MQRFALRASRFWASRFWANGMLVLLLSGSAAWASVESTATQIDQIIQKYARLHEFSGSALVARKGEIVFERSYGIADVSTNDPVESDTRFILASITKPLVATLVLQQVEEGRLRLGDSIRSFIPDTPTSWQAVRIENLLDHTSGIYDYLNEPELQQIRYKSLAPKQIIDLFKAKPLAFTPGSRYAYSNLGYLILGYVLEQLTRMPFSDLLRERILNPQGMTSSGVWGFDEQLMHPLAIGYEWKGGKYVLPPQMNPSIAFADGDVFSTPRDLLRFDQGLSNGQLLSAETIANMLTPRQGAYGLGFRIAQVNGHRLAYHNGHLVGNLNRFARYVDDGLTIILLNHIDTGKVTEISDRIAALLFGERYVPRAPVEREED